MSTKALKKELLAAVVMLMVAAVALSGSTYAWFAQNTKVTASEVDITAQTAKNLSISDAEGGTYGTSMTLTNVTSPGGTKFWPVSATVDGKNLGLAASQADLTTTKAAFYIIKSDNKVLSADASAATTSFAVAFAAGTSSETFTKSFEANSANHWTDNVWLRYDYTGDQTTAINATVTAILNTTKAALADKDITKAYHVAMVCDADASGSGYNWKMGEITSIADSDGDGYYEATISFPNLFTALKSNDPELVSLYIWYEGEDTDCFSTASVAPDLLTTSFEFGIPTA